MSERESVLDHARRVIRDGWPMRNDYFGVRLTLRSIIRSAKQLRDQEAARKQHNAATGVPDLYIDGKPYEGELLFPDLEDLRG